MSPSARTASDVPDMNLYKLNRVHRVLEKLKDKPTWTADDTKEFDCMHYLGDAAIENAARELRLQPGQRVLDIGSGFGGTGRYLYRHYGASTTGIELQDDIHEIANTINERSGAAAAGGGGDAGGGGGGGGGAVSIGGNFLELDPGRMGAPVDHVVSFLCILHIAEREALFRKAHEVLKPGGRVYIEDFFAREGDLGERTLELLRGSVSCPDLPDQRRYVAELEAAGFEVVSWVDMSDIWTDFVGRRAADYKRDPSVDADLTAFYDAVEEVFAGGQVGGVRITCQRK